MKENIIIELKNVSKQFDQTYAVDNFNLYVKEGEFITFLGPSGCGKTTTLRMIAGFELPTEGQILLSGKDITLLPPYKRPVNTVFQKYALFPHMDVYDNATIEAYDTYSSQGLPPGAICNPGIEAIDAVLAAIPSENFFFYANIDTKITYFAKTNEEHEANIAMVKQQYEDAEAAREAEENE